MEVSTERTELIVRATKALFDDSTVGAHFGTSPKTAEYNAFPDINLNKILELVQKDPVVRGAITTLVDRTLENKYSFYGKDKKSREVKATRKMEELRLRRVLNGVLQHLFTYSNAFIEIVNKNKEPEELHTVDPRKIEPVVDGHGEVLRYEYNAGSGDATWTPEEIVHLKITPLSNMVWGDIDIQALWMSCAIKYHIKKLYLHQYEHNEFRPLLNFKNSSDEQIKRFITHLQQASRGVKGMIPIEGEIEVILLGQMQDYDKVKSLLTYLDYEILNLLQVPPIAVGLPDNSNRSNTDGQDRAFNTRIKAIRAYLEDVITYDLLPRLGFDKVYMQFDVIDDLAMQKYLEMAKMMKDMQFKEEIIRDFLIDKGWEFPDGEIFDQTVEPVTGKMTGGDNTNAPSRQGKAVGAANERIGTGERGTTREEQLITRTIPSWQKYGTIEYEVD